MVEREVDYIVKREALFPRFMVITTAEDYIVTKFIEIATKVIEIVTKSIDISKTHRKVHKSHRSIAPQ
ncbi:MAG: hypothetical protein GX072_07490 [Lysinibacillus sp.]|nr:hypothetical protein [Lysinibacillus sp.]